MAPNQISPLQNQSKNKTMKSFNLYLSLIIISLLITSCGSDPEPNEIFLGSYTAQKFCNDEDSFVSQIMPGALGTDIIWANAAGEDGTEDDLRGTISGNTITINQQSIGGGLDMSGTGTLQDNGNIQMTTVIHAGSIRVSCNITFTPQ